MALRRIISYTGYHERAQIPYPDIQISMDCYSPLGKSHVDKITRHGQPQHRPRGHPAQKQLPSRFPLLVHKRTSGTTEPSLALHPKPTPKAGRGREVSAGVVRRARC